MRILQAAAAAVCGLALAGCAAALPVATMAAPASPVVSTIQAGNAGHLVTTTGTADVQVDNVTWTVDDGGTHAMNATLEYFCRTGTFDVNPLYWDAVAPDGEHYSAAIVGEQLPLLPSETMTAGEHLQGDVVLAAPNSPGTDLELTVDFTGRVIFHTDS